MFYIYADGQQIYAPLDDLLILFNPKLTLEMGKAGSLEFGIPPLNPYYDKLKQLTTEISVEMDDVELFHGRVLSNERAFNNVRQVYCEGDLSYLVDSVQKGVRYSGTTHSLFESIIANHNARMDASKRFTVGTVTIENRSIVLVGNSDGENDNLNTGSIDYKQIALDSVVDEWNNTLDYIQTCIIDYCGGYLRTRRVNGTTYIDLLEDYNNTTSQPIELGLNLLDLTEEISAEDVFTVLIPLGDDNLTVASVNGGSDEIVDEVGVLKYGRIVKTHVFSNVSSASTLLENARRFMSSNVNIPRTITVKAVDLHLIDSRVSPIKIGDTVSIVSDAHDVDDTLTCTKIEYDLERPENNSYTFGNPKQTLTQRYREDVRLSKDTYGNSAVSATPSAAVASSAAAAATAEEAEKERDKALENFYDAWVKYDPDSATVSLGALAKEFYDGKEVLKSQCGIDLDGKTGNINISSLHNQVDDHGRIIAANEARIAVVETDTAVAIENIAQRHEDLAGEVADHYTAINQRADTLGSKIELLAKDVHDYDDKATTSIASLTQRADDIVASIDANTSFISSVNDREVSHYTSITQKSTELESSIRSMTGALNDLSDRESSHYTKIEQISNRNSDSINLIAQRSTANENNIASIKVRVTNTESSIALKADKVYVDGKFSAAQAEIADLTSGRTTANKLRATDIMAGSIALWDESGAVAVASMKHSHDFAILEGNNGEVTISIGNATDKVPQKQSFNIADTQYFKDHVSAVTVKSLDITDSQTGFNSNTHIKKVVIDAIAKDDSNNVLITNSKTLEIDASSLYNNAIDSVKIESVARDGEATYQTGYRRYSIPVIATASNGDTKTVELFVSASEAYDAGAASATPPTVSSISLNKVNAYDPGWTFEDPIFTINVKATLSNGTIGTDTIELDATSQLSAAKNSVVIDDISISGEPSPSASNVGIITATALASNNRTSSGTYNIYLIASQNTSTEVAMQVVDGSNNVLASRSLTPVNAHINSVSATSYDTVGDFNVILGDAYVQYSNGLLVGRVNIVLSDNTTKSCVVRVDGTKAFDAGAASSPSATVSSISLNKANSSDPGWSFSSPIFTVKVKATLSDGTYGTGTVAVDATSQLNAATTAGVNSVSVSTVDISGASSSIENRGVITATATASNSSTKTGSYNVYLNVTQNTASGVTMQIVDASNNVLASRTATPPVTTISSVSQYSYSTSGDFDVSLEDGYIRYSSGDLIGRVVIALSDNTTKTCVVRLNGTKAYNAGATSVEIPTVSTIALNKSSSSDPGWTFSSPNYTVKIKATLSNGTYGTGTVTIDATSQLNAATNAVTVSTVAISGAASSVENRGVITATATASNSNTKTGTYNVYLNVTQNTTSGVTMQIVDANSNVLASRTITPTTVTISSVSRASYSTSGDFDASIEDSYVRYSSGNLIGRVTIALSDNTSKTCVVRLDGTRAYNAGVASVVIPTVSTIALNKSSSSDPGWTFSSPNYTVKIKATLSDGTYGTGTVTVDATSQLNAAANAVTVSTVAISGAASSVENRGVITATATASNSNTKTGTYNVYLNVTQNTTSGVTMQIVDANSNVLASRTITPTTVTISSVSRASYSTSGDFDASIEDSYVRYSSGNLIGRVTIALSDNTSKTCVVRLDGTRAYNAGYDAGVASVVVPTISSVSRASYSTTGDFDVSISNSYVRYSSGNLIGRVTIALSNNTSKTCVVRLDGTRAYNAGASAGVSSIVIGRATDTLDDMATSGDKVYVTAKATAYNGTTVLSTETANVDITDIVEIALGVNEVASGKILSTTASTYGQYDSGYSFGVSGKTYTSGNYQYARIGLYSSSRYGTALLKTIRVVIPAASSNVASITSNSTSSNYSDYYISGGRWMLYVHAKDSSGNVLKTDSIDVQHAVNYGMEQGGGVSGTPITLSCTGKTNDTGIVATYTFSVRGSYSFVSGRNYTFYY